MWGSPMKLSHGESRGKTTREYNTWNGMRARCLTPTSARYADYGGRGITVCQRWMVYENFLADMGRKPTPDHSLDRIDNDKGYEPGNCRWATRKEQCRNRRSGRLLTLRGETLTVAEWAERSGVDERRVRDRLGDGWDADEAVFTPKGQSCVQPKLTAEQIHDILEMCRKGTSQSAAARKYGVHHSTVNILCRKWLRRQRVAMLASMRERARKLGGGA
jgi:hypothetical protein